MSIILLLWLIGGMSISSIDSRTSVDVHKQCTPITEPICQEIRYTQTRMSDSIGIYSQNDARKRITNFIPLINIRCSNYLKLFLCSVYFPICDSETPPTGPIVKPCRQLCVHVKQRCEPFMKESLQLSWPDELDCEKLPTESKICPSSNSFNSVEQDPKIIIATEDVKFNQLIRGNQVNRWLTERKCLPSEINVGISPNVSCSQLCSANVQFTESDKKFAKVWLMTWSALCFFSCLLTIIVFSCNTNRFLYPEKPIVFLSICYFFYASGNLLGAILGFQNVACQQFDDHTNFLVSHGRETTWCKINFLMVYFFGSASSLWWVVLTITWFLSASRHWGYEAIESISSMLHLLSWAVPALKSILILILHKIDADELTGQCFVGNTNQNALWAFVIVPHIIYLIIGIIFLVLGYISLLKVRRSFLQRPDCGDTNNLKRLEKLMAKIGVFSILYIVPAVCTIASYIADGYKITYLDVAIRALYQFSSNCVSRNGISWSISKCLDIIHPMLPSVEIRMLRIFMNLVIGITSGIWIWGNSKTIKSFITTIRCLGGIKENHINLINQYDSVTMPIIFPASQVNQKEPVLPYPDWKSNSSYPNNEFALQSVSVPSEIVNHPPNNTSSSDLSSKH